MNNPALHKLVGEPGQQSMLAARLRGMGYKVKQGHIWGWLHMNRPETCPPPVYVIPICRAFNWEITPHSLRSDLYPNPWDGLPPMIAMGRFPGLVLPDAA